MLLAVSKPIVTLNSFVVAVAQEVEQSIYRLEGCCIWSVNVR